MFDRLYEVINNVEKLDRGDLMKELFNDKEVRDKIIELNTINQLFNKGVDATGKLLSEIGGPYAEVTIEGSKNIIGKKQRGLPYDHITLFDTGEFYKSFQVYLISDNDYQITANPIKDATNLFTEWGANVIGLTEESLVNLREFIRPKAIEIIRKSILQSRLAA